MAPKKRMGRQAALATFAQDAAAVEVDFPTLTPNSMASATPSIAAPTDFECPTTETAPTAHIPLLSPVIIPAKLPVQKPPHASVDDQTSVKGASRLPHLPEHILDDIASYLTTSALRRLMRTCQALRQVAEKTIRPMYSDMLVTPTPHLITSTFSRPDPKLAAVDEARWRHLRKLHARAESLIDTFSAASQVLCRLKVEVRCDDRRSGWSLIERFSSQLEMLIIHILDELWQWPASYDDDGDGPFNIYPDPQDAVQDSWSLDFFFDPLRLSFPLLTSLTICATARTYSYLILLADAVPSLRSLTLSAFGRDDLDLDNEPAEFPDLPCFPKLHTLTISGDDAPMSILLSGIVANSSHIRQLIIYNTAQTCLTRTIPNIVYNIMSCQQLVGLAIYGAITGELMSIMAAYVGHEEADRRVLSHVSDLAVECEFGYPMLELIEEAPALALPSLERLACIDRRRPPKPGMIRMPSGEMVFDDRFTLWDPEPEYYLESEMDLVLEQYPKLKRVQWVGAYWTAPFVDHPPSKWEKLHVKCSVNRPEPGQHSQPLYPPFS